MNRARNNKTKLGVTFLRKLFDHFYRNIFPQFPLETQKQSNQVERLFPVS